MKNRYKGAAVAIVLIYIISSFASGTGIRLYAAGVSGTSSEAKASSAKALAGQNGGAGLDPYQVKKGDNLWKLSDEFYGEGALYRKIFEANQDVIGQDANLIFPGMVFYLPTIAAGQSPTDHAGSGKAGESPDKAGRNETAESGKAGESPDKAGRNETAESGKAGESPDKAGRNETAESGKAGETQDNSTAADPGDESSKSDTGHKGTGVGDEFSEEEESEIRDFFTAYYSALANGNAEYCEALHESLSSEDKKLIGSIASYIDRFENLRCRVLEGPADGSYVAFVDYLAVSGKDDHKFDYMEAFYLCRDGRTGFRILAPETYFKDLSRK